MRAAFFAADKQAQDLAQSRLKTNLDILAPPVTFAPETSLCLRNGNKP